MGNTPGGYDMGKSFADLGGTGGGIGPGGPTSQMAGKPTQSNPMLAAFQGPQAQAPGGAAFGAQPKAPVQSPAMFSPNLPNHTLPQGFASAFPNSLSPADKALLYANALRTG